MGRPENDTEKKDRKREVGKEREIKKERIGVSVCVLSCE